MLTSQCYDVTMRFIPTPGTPDQRRWTRLQEVSWLDRASASFPSGPSGAHRCFTPLTRRMPAASSGQSKWVSAASYANRRTAASPRLIVPTSIQETRGAGEPENYHPIQSKARFEKTPTDELLDREIHVRHSLRLQKGYRLSLHESAELAEYGLLPQQPADVSTKLPARRAAPEFKVV